MSRVQELTTQLSYVPRTLRLVWRAARAWTLAWFAVLCIEGLLPAVLVYLSRSLIDTLATTLGAGSSWHDLRPAALPALFMGEWSCCKR